MRKVRVALWGFGAMGKGIARVLLERKGVEIVGVCDRYEGYAGKNAYELLNLPSFDRAPITISGDIARALAATPIDCCVIATDSFVRDVFPKIREVVTRGINVVTIAEEMS